MKSQLSKLARRYQAGLCRYLNGGPQASLLSARGLGRQAAALDLETLDVARIHEAALTARGASSRRKKVIKQAASFFAEVIAPIEKTHRVSLDANVRLRQLKKTLGRRTVDLVVSKQSLKRGIARRKSAEKAAKKSAGHYARLVKEARRLQEHLRHLTHRVLSAQEAERKKISRELHDEVAQTLLGINVRLLALQHGAMANTEGLKKEIASTQRLVGKSVKTMSRFAREFGKQHDT